MNIDDQKSWEEVMQQNKLNVQMPNSAYAPSTTNSYQLSPNAEGGYDDSSITAYKAYLRSLPEVQYMTGQIDVQNPNSIILFGQEASNCITQISDEALQILHDYGVYRVVDNAIFFQVMMDAAKQSGASGLAYLKPLFIDEEGLHVEIVGIPVDTVDYDHGTKALPYQH